MSDKAAIQLELCLGIITGDEKRSLECYVDPRYFSQRKSFDEYYTSNDMITVKLDLRDLMILAEEFKVIVHNDSVMLREV